MASVLPDEEEEVQEYYVHGMRHQKHVLRLLGEEGVAKVLKYGQKNRAFFFFHPAGTLFIPALIPSKKIWFVHFTVPPETRRDCKVTRRDCKVTRRDCKVTRRDCKVTRRDCKKSRRDCKVTRRDCKVSRRDCKVKKKIFFFYS